MANEKNNPQLPFGINKDTEPTKQIKNTYRFALNAVHDDKEGSLGSLVNENGNESCFTLPTGFIQIGHVPINDGNTIIISRNVSTDVSEIGLKEDCTYTSLITTDCFDFDECYQVKGEFKVRQGCERTITLYDCNGDDKYINLDRLELYYTEAFKTYLNANPGTTPAQYFTATGLYAWDCNKMLLNPFFDYPCLTFVEEISGGNLFMGTYQFSAQLMDEAFNVLGYTLFTQPIPVYDESIGANWLFKDGGLNLPPYSADVGGVPSTGKSINLNITGLADPIAFIRLIVKRNSTGDGVTGEVFALGNVIPISSSLDITFSGINPDEDLTFPITDVVIPTQKYKTSCAQEQVDTRLIRGNLTERTYDWGDVQQAANTITSEWSVQDLESAEDNDGDNTKKPNYYFAKRGYQRDEIYSFGIVLRFKDDTYSPVFHIPGRPFIKAADTLTQPSTPSNAVAHGNLTLHNRNQVPRIADGDATDEDWDEQLLNVVAVIVNAKTDVLLQDVRHLGFTTILDDIGYGVGKVIRWKVYNTCIPYNVVNPFANERGLFAYHESNLRYPEVKNCDGNFIYPLDPTDATKTAFIRHHRFPDNIAANIGSSTNISPLGVLFDTNSFYAALPADLLTNLDGHIFVRGKRTDSNKTVYDMGSIVYNNLFVDLGANYYLPSYVPFTVPSTESIGFIYSPTISFNNSFYGTGYYIKNEGSYISTQQGTGSNWRYIEHEGLDLTNLANQFQFAQIDESYWLGPGQLQSLNSVAGFVRNEGMGCPALAIYTDWAVTANLDYSVITIKRIQDVYSNVTAIEYVPISNCLEVDTSLLVAQPAIYGGDTFIAPLSLSFHNYESYIITTFPLLTHLIISPVDATAYRGIVHRFYFESIINSNLRHSGVEPCNNYFEKNFQAGTTNIDDALEAYFDDTKNTAGCGEDFFGYNPDYGMTLNENVFLTLPITYNYCSDCEGKFPNRMAFSPKSFETEVADNWKVYQANDFIDIDASKGDITNIKFDKNQMLISTEESLFSMTPNPQTMNTDVDTVFIGTGDFLSIPPNQFLNKAHGYAGNQGRYNAINTEYGYLWLDQKDGKVFQYFNGKLNELSDTGLNYWFGENLPSNLQIKDYFCKDNTAYDRGIGIISTYDPLFERYIIHKRDFEVVDSIWSSILPVPANLATVVVGLYYYDTTGIYEATAPSTITLVPFTNETVFINKSWTISYSFKTNSWISWHSYMPNYMFFDNDNFYTKITAFDDIWKHSPRNFQNFYGTKYDFIMEFITKDFITHAPHNLHWYSQTQLYDDTLEYYQDVDTQTFDKLMVYTRRQSTGKMDLVTMDKHTDPFTNIGWSNISKQVIITDKNVKVGQLRDLAISQPVITRRWTDIQGEFGNPNGQGYIDLVPYSTSIDTARSQYDLRDLKDKYYHIRLYFSSSIVPDYKLVLDIINTVTHKSHR